MENCKKALFLNNKVISRTTIILNLVLVLLIITNTKFAFAQEDHNAIETLIDFSNPAHLWGNGVERVIEEAYRQFFRTKIIDGRVMNVRIPFAMRGDRDILIETKMQIVGDGKADPETLWHVIEEIFKTEDFNEYINALSSGHEKVIIFDMAQRQWSVSTDMLIIARIKSRTYRGLPHRPLVLTSGKGALESDIYNYLLCIGYTGIDCSGFVWHILSYTAKQSGLDLGNALSYVLGVPPGSNPALYVGTAFFNSVNSQVTAVNDLISNLRPADIMLFRDVDGTVIHSAIIQSIDWNRGIIRYLQCTSVGMPHERGVHDSFIYFDPSNTAVSLKDPSLHWSKKRFPSFLGEEIPFVDDGERYRHRVGGGGRVVRLRAMEQVIERIGN